MKPIFKKYNQQQNWLFPSSIEEIIPKDHPVRIVNGVLSNGFQITNQKKLSQLPKTMLKIMVYTYRDNTYSVN